MGDVTTDGENGLNGHDQKVSSVDSTSSSPTQEQAVSPDMLYKLSKKIAQLTKVIYSLNTRNDDLEWDLENVRAGYEERLQLCQQQLHLASNNLSSIGSEVSNLSGDDGGDCVNGSRKSSTGSGRSKTPEAPDSETKRELKKTRLALKNLESKLKNIEREMSEKSSELEKAQEEVARMRASDQNGGCENGSIDKAPLLEDTVSDFLISGLFCGCNGSESISQPQ